MVDTETDYLPHVVHCENGGAPLESLKAQAVASRTYLAYKMDTSGSIADGQGDQVYTCASEPDANDIEAVNETSGIVLQYKNASIAAFFVAGADSTPPACMDEGTDSTDTVQYVTYNQGLSGSNINQTSLGFVDPTNYANRGCMSQLGSRCLANGGDSFDTILKFYYGDDIQIVQSTGTCVVANAPDGGGSIVQPDGGIIGSKGGTGGPAPSRKDGGGATSSDDGSTLNDSNGCSFSARGRDEYSFEMIFGVGMALAAFARKMRKSRPKIVQNNV
jgi:stage II sporulation SpoD-like protein